MTYAKGTAVSTDRSRSEVDRILARAGATQRMMGVDDVAGVAFVGFSLSGRQVRLRVPMPMLNDKAFSRDGRGATRTPQKRQEAHEQACRERWRQVVLLLKAKLEAVALGLSTIEREFLADLYLSDGRTVHEAITEDLAHMYETGKVPLLLGGKPR